MSAERERSGRRALGPTLRTLATALTALALGAGLLLDPLAAAGVADAARSVTTDDTDGVALDVVAAPSATGVVRPGEPLSVRVTVSNPSRQPTGEIALTLAIDGARSVDPAELSAWFEAGTDGGEDGSEGRAVAAATLSSLDPGASAVLDLIVPVSDTVLSGSFGPRLASVRAEAGETGGGLTVVTDRTAVVWVPDTAAVPIASTTFVAAITTPGETAAVLSAEQLERYTGEAGALSRTLDAVAGRPVLLAIDPRIIASIRLLGDQAPASAVAFLARLEAAPNDSVLLPWADADPVATISAASIPLPLPEGAGVPTAGSTEGDATPSPSPTPEQSITLDELSAWPTTIAGLAWAESGAITADSIAVLAEQGTSVLIAPGSSLADDDPVQQLSDVRVLRADDALSAAARDASLAVSQQRFDRAMARVSALLAASAEGQPGIPALIALGRDRLAGSDRLLDTIAQTVALPWSTGTSASEVLARPAVDGAIIERALDPERADEIRAALTAEADDRLFATIAVTPEAITDVRRLELLAALSLGWGERSVEALQRFVSSSVALRSSVQVVESSAITLLADRASLPVTVQNDLNVAVRVFVRVEPDTAQLRVVDSRVETLVEPQSQTRALVPVESLTNGQVDITVTVRDSESRVIGSPTRVALNLQAGWETAGTIAVAIALVLLLTVGITRDIRKRRRRRAEEA
ncbi:DUF6049 family protein [Microcella sp.]|uniref:DUF6049 family protein n=1 Tax=Microcella sp. TaxID=1913979 RepID=UPI003F704EC5